MPHSPDGFKVCTGCGVRKPLGDYFKNSQSKSDGVSSRCKVCKKASTKVWIENNRDRHNENQRRQSKSEGEVARRKEYLSRPEVIERGNQLARQRRKMPHVIEKNKEIERSEAVRKYRDEYKKTEKYQKWVREYRRTEEFRERSRQNAAKRRQNPKGNIENRMSSAIWRAVQGKKNGRKWPSLVGYTIEELMKHLEKQFLKGMGWHNFGEWHIDHIVPKARFDYDNPEDSEFKACWSLGNLRPLWAEDNHKKSSKNLFLM